MDEGKEIRRAVGEEWVDLRQARNVKALSGHEHGYCLRTGRNRVLFELLKDHPCIVLMKK